MSKNQKNRSDSIKKGNIAWFKVGKVIILALISAKVFPGLIIMPIGFLIAGLVFLILNYGKKA